MILLRDLVWDAANSTTLGNKTLTVDKIWVAGNDDREEHVGAQEGGPPGGSTDQVVLGVATLE